MRDMISGLSVRVKFFAALGLLFVACVALGVMTLMWRSEDRRADKAEKEATAVREDLNTCRSNLVTLSDAAGRQNRAVLDMKAERDAALKRSEELSRQAAREAKKHEQAIARLRALKPGPNECESARQLLAEELRP